MSEPLPPDDAPRSPRPVHPPRPGGLRTISASTAEEVSSPRHRPGFLPPPTATPLPPSDVAPATVLMPAPLAHKSRLLSKAEAPAASTSEAPAARGMSPSEGPALDGAAVKAPGIGFYTGVAAAPVAPARPLGTLLRLAAAAAAIAGLVVVAWPVSLELSRDDERRITTLWVTTAAPGRVRTDDVSRLVGSIGASVAAPLQAELGGREPRFVVVADDSSARLFAFPDATIAVTTGTLRRLDNSAELAALLAHSLVHVARGDALAALHDAGDAGPIMDALAPGSDVDDVKAGLAVVSRALMATSQPEVEQAVDIRTREVLAAAGWSTRAPAEAAKALEGRHGRLRAAWLSAHPGSKERLVGGDGGQLGEAAWLKSVLGPLSGRR